MKIIAFGASYHKKSINREFAGWVAHMFPAHEVDLLDLNNFEIPMYTQDLEEELGIPKDVQTFVNTLATADFLVVSMGEHNGSYQAAFKNLMDWSSRFKYEFFNGCNLFLLSTSTGAKGAQSVFNTAKESFPRFGANIVDGFSLPSFNDNYSRDEGVKDAELKKELEGKVQAITQKYLS